MAGVTVFPIDPMLQSSKWWNISQEIKALGIKPAVIAVDTRDLDFLSDIDPRHHSECLSMSMDFLAQDFNAASLILQQPGAGSLCVATTTILICEDGGAITQIRPKEGQAMT